MGVILILICIGALGFLLWKGLKKEPAAPKSETKVTYNVKEETTSERRISGDLANTHDDIPPIPTVLPNNISKVNETILKYVEKKNIWICPVCDAENETERNTCCVCKTIKH